jgi:hypothetical protein
MRHHQVNIDRVQYKRKINFWCRQDAYWPPQIAQDSGELQSRDSRMTAPEIKVCDPFAAACAANAFGR